MLLMRKNVLQIKHDNVFVYFSLQEFGNIAYVEKGGFGVYTGNRPRSVAKAVVNLFSNDTLLQDMSQRGRSSCHMYATKKIAKEIAIAALEKKLGGLEV